jgi:signal transduction histidine kinase
MMLAMQTQHDASNRIVRLAIWVWIGYLMLLAAFDFILYAYSPSLTGVPSPRPLLPRGATVFRSGISLSPFAPVFTYYAANSFLALFFLVVAYWSWLQKRLGGIFYPLLLVAISTAPILLNQLVVPHFPLGPLSNPEGMALRQLPILFLGLALMAWQYKLSQVIFYSLATAGLELSLLPLTGTPSQTVSLYVFVTLVRTISFIAIGVFIALIVAQLRQQQAALRQANANLTHYASTLEQLAVSRERNRISRELHDTVVHSLSSLTVQLEAALAYVDIDRSTVKSLLEQSWETAHTGLQETRRSINDLRVSQLDDLGLVIALQQLTKSAAERGKFGLEVSFPEPGTVLSPDVEQCIYRVTQEAVENVVRHANARHLWVRLEVNSNETCLLIRDDGVGFRPEINTPPNHFGLSGLQERAQVAGGVLTIESKPSQGTTVQLVIGA